MIINGGSRSNGGFFASHLMRADHNERVSVIEMRDLGHAEDLEAAFAVLKARACGTLCKNFFYHADINTRADEVLSPEQWTEAVNALENELGLSGQPRLIVEHQKEGRTHQHIVWSRMDTATMKAIPDSHNYRKHEAVSRAMEHAFEHVPTRGTLSREYGTERPERCPKDWESFRAQESGIDPKAIKGELTALWSQADSGKAFIAAVEAQGYILARGDRRDFCIIDRAGDDHSLARQLSDVKAAGVRARMADVDRDALPSVAEARQLARTHWEDTNSGDPRTSALAGAEATERPIELTPFEAVQLETERQALRASAPAEDIAPTFAPQIAPETSRVQTFFDSLVESTERAAVAHLHHVQSAPPEATRFARWSSWLENMMEYAVHWKHYLADIVIEKFWHADPDERAGKTERETER